MSIQTISKPIELGYTPWGGAREVWRCKDNEVLIAGPSGTGKTRGVFEKLHHLALKYPGMRGLVVRKTHADLTATALVTFQRRVLSVPGEVAWYGGSPREAPQFIYANGSRILVGGMDRATKIMSGEYDVVYVNEATELSENDWEYITTRLRNWRMPYQQLIGDCNPDAPHHWLKKRCDEGKCRMILSRHEDNPELWDRKRGEWTERGAVYIARLDGLSGVRKRRLRFGQWAAAEGMVFDRYDAAIHLIDRPKVPDSWQRLWSIDFGYTHPFVWQEWAIDPDGRMYRIREIYMTQRIVEDHAAVIKRETRYSPRPVAVVCDHDAEDRATLERHLGISTVGARKAVRVGIDAVQGRLRKAGDGRPRLFLCKGALVERDPYLSEAHRPCRSEEEIEAYVWPQARPGRPNDVPPDEPVKQNDHGMDAMRYAVMYLDGGTEGVEKGMELWD